MVGVIDSGDLARALGLLSVSMDPHDLWFKRQLAAVTGVDLNDAPQLPQAEAAARPSEVATRPSHEAQTPRQPIGPLGALISPAEG